MITIYLGNVGSGKTACAVREILNNENRRKTFSNIRTKNLKNNVEINPSMIIRKVQVDTKVKRDGTVVPVYEIRLNKEFWQAIKEPINVVLDEAHTIINARRSMSKVNQIVTDWLALIRRVLGSADSGFGELILISQLHNRVDIIAREMATQVRYHRAHYHKECRRCGFTWRESSDMPEPVHICPVCSDYRINKFGHKIEVWHFQNMRAYLGWSEWGMDTFYRHYMVNDIEKVFPLYDTLQWDNMFSEFY